MSSIKAGRDLRFRPVRAGDEGGSAGTIVGLWTLRLRFSSRRTVLHEMRGID